jgi:glycolate oxidase FAD binding subunit
VRAEKAGKHPLIARIDVLPARLPDMLTQAAAALPDAHIEAQPWDGVCRIGLAQSSAGVVEGIRRIAGMFGGPCVIERCPVELKREIDVFGEAPSAFALMQAIKQEFDPNVVLSPGRFVGRL